ERLLPPWSAAWQALPAAEQERFQKARLTLARLENLAWRAHRPPEVQAVQKRFNASARRDDPVAFGRAMQEFNRAVQTQRQRLLEALRAEGEETVDQAVLALWEQLSGREEGAGAKRAGARPGGADEPEKSGDAANEPALRARAQALEKGPEPLLRELAAR